VHIGTTIGIGGAALAGTGAFVATSQLAGGGGASTGALVPTTLAGAALGSVVVGTVASGAWRWSGAPRLASAMSGATWPLLLATAGAAAGVGAALLVDRFHPAARDLDSASLEAATRMRADAQRLRVGNDARDRSTAVELEDASAEHEAAHEVLDATLEAHGGRIGASGTVGAGRLDVTGLSPEAAADVVFDAYAPHAERIDPDAVRVQGPNVFRADALFGEVGTARANMVEFFAQQVDTEEPKGVISAREARTWQAGRLGEQRTHGLADASSNGARE
jgi:hypothetical protein